MKIVFTLFWLSMLQAQAPVPCPPAALTESQVLQLVKDRVPEGRIVQIVGTCRVDSVTREMLARLRTGGATEAVLAAVRSQRQLTLDQARQEITGLEEKIEEVRAQGRPARDRRLEQVDADYRGQREKLGELAPKDRYETAAEYAARQAEWIQAREEVDRKHKAAREEIERAYEAEVQEGGRPYLAEIAALKARTYPMEGAKLEFLDYDADNGILKGKLGGREYWFAVPRESARRMDLETHPAAARAERPIEDDASPTRVLVETATGKRFPGVPMGDPIAGEFVAIPAGEFMMGSDSGEPNEKPRHWVRITKAFEMGKYEVTQTQWNAVMGANPSNIKGDDRPVETVSWNDVQEFLKRLNARDDGYRYRLPTEAEWEYAARAGSTADKVADLDAVAWYSGNSGSETHPVGRKRANPWGLYDMLGNVWEWCADWYGADYYTSSPVEDPQGPGSGSIRVVRGASFLDGAYVPRGASRNGYGPVIRSFILGFRCVREARLP
jgi:formylglycine-generating enzyme required for sulfatase activity